MKDVRYTGDFKDLKGFMKGLKDPFCEGTYYKALGNDKFILIRQTGEVRLRVGDLIFFNTEEETNILTKLKLPFELVGEDDDN